MNRVCWLVVFLLGPLAGGLRAQTAVVSGVVLDSTTTLPLGDAQVVLVVGSFTLRRVVTEAGRFRFARIPAGSFTVRATRIGYRPHEVAGIVGPGDTVRLTLRMAAIGVPLDPVVVSASRSPETALDAPTAVSVVGHEEIERTPTLAPVEVVRDEPGMVMASKGLIQRTFSVRGDATVNSGSLLFLTDYRYSALPSVAFNIPYLVAATPEDLERIEVVRGPASALYGPGAPRGVLHFITRSPFESPGGTVSMTGGSRSSVGGDFRIADVLSSHLAMKLSGSYLRGNDWPSTDATEQRKRAEAIANGANPDTLRIGLRDFTLGRASGEARVDWRPDDRTQLITTVGAAEALSAVDLTPFGGIQGKDWRYSFGQVRLQRDRLFVNAFYNWSNAGDTYILRTGDPLVDDSRVIVGQLQHGVAVGPVDLLYGADVRWTDPRTGGTIHGLNENRDRTTEIGAYVHGTWRVSPKLEAFGAGRIDHHSALNDVVFSPRLALVYKPAPTHAIRASYNRAFTSPDANDLFLDLKAGTIDLPGGFGYTVFGTGVPKDGFHFLRNCDGLLCMRSPFAIAMGGSPYEYLPADATVLWPAIVAYAKTQGIDLSGIPAPSSADVGTRIARLDLGSETFVDINPSQVTNIQGEGRTITNALEVGYKGFFANLGVTLDLWMMRVSDAAGSQYIGTPSVFFDQETLRSYLARYMPADQAAELAGTIAMIPAGTISPVETPHPTDLLAVSPRGGAYTLWGADLGLDVALSPAWRLGGTYSWVNADTIPNVKVLGVVYLNAPRDRASLRAEYTNARLGITAGVRGRYVRSFPVKNGEYDGWVDAYTLVDLAMGATLPWWHAATVTVAVQNALNDRHIEFVGAPVLGRFVLMRLRVGW